MDDIATAIRIVEVVAAIAAAMALETTWVTK